MKHVVYIAGFLIAVAASNAQERIDLGGQWQRRIAGRLHDFVVVPSSYRPLGTALLRREFELPRIGTNRRILLRFEGIAHRATVQVNGAEVGVMGPWTPYTFDITENVKLGRNELGVEVTDWQVPLGPVGAWEASGGIIRDVRLEIRPESYIENAHFRYTLDPSLGAAHVLLDTYLQSTQPGRGRIHAELRRGGVLISEISSTVELTAGTKKHTLEWDIQAPALWTPEVPILYTLRARLSGAFGEDSFTEDVGFRKIEVRGSRFLLNGRTLVLRGVCRHDLWPNQGHTLTDAQIEQDLSMIKTMGANFVRLVHYPHDRRVVRAANRLGLFVTEESGLVWLDFQKISRDTLETGISNLERTILRDWNSPALFAVLLANESAPTLEAIQEARRRVRALDPGLLMSSARVDGPGRDFPSSKRLFDEGGLDFYTDHKYGYDMRMFGQSVEAYSGKPLVFTEWGGRAIGQSAVLMKMTAETIGRLVEQGKLAGYSFWSWADLPEFSRQDEEMEDGILKSGVVTEDRNPRMDVYLALTELYRRLPGREPTVPQTPEVLRPLAMPLSANSEFVPISLQSTSDSSAQEAAWSELEALMERFWKTQGFTSTHWQTTGRKLWFWNTSKLEIGHFPFETPVKEGAARPLVVTPRNPRVEIPANVRASRLHFLGNVSLPDGYPVLGRLGERIGRYVVEYEDGERQEVPLRWGVEIARSNLISVATRIDATTAEGERVLMFKKDPVREVHQARLLSISTKGQQIRRIVLELEGAPAEAANQPAKMHRASGSKPGATEQVLLVFAITAERTPQQAGSSFQYSR